MGTLGPLPEQPFVSDVIPLVDLRDAIRAEHGLGAIGTRQQEHIRTIRHPLRWAWIAVYGSALLANAPLTLSLTVVVFLFVVFIGLVL